MMDKAEVVAPKVRPSIAQGETLGVGQRANAVALKGRHSGGVSTNPGFRCAPPWAIEYDRFGIGSSRRKPTARRSQKLVAIRTLAIALVALLFTRPAWTIEDHFFNSHGVTLRYIDEGQGEPVLLIHGFCGSLHLQWGGPGILQSLAKDYRVIAYDNRGHGRSGKPHDPAKYGDELVEDAVRLLDHLGIDKAHIVGYSLGAFITDKLLAEHPQRFLTATLAGGGWAKADDDRAEFIGEVARSLDEGNGIGPLLIKLTPEGRPKPSEARLRRANRLFSLVNDQKALAAVIRGMKDLTVSEQQLRANRVPTLAIVGEIDPIKVTVDELSQVMPNLQVYVIKDADHIGAFLRPEFSQALRTFLAEHSSQAGAAATNGASGREKMASLPGAVWTRRRRPR